MSFIHILFECSFENEVQVQLWSVKQNEWNSSNKVNEFLISVPPKDLDFSSFAWVKICQDSDSHLSKSSLSWEAL